MSEGYLICHFHKILHLPLVHDRMQLELQMFFKVINIAEHF